MTSVTRSYPSNEMAVFRTVVWLETLALSLLLWMAIIHVIARALPA